MSKDQKKTNDYIVENVEKSIEIIDWIDTTISFWKLEDNWPTNLIKDCLPELKDFLYQIKRATLI